MRYSQLLASGLVNIGEFVQDYPADIRQELAEHLELSLLIGEPQEPIILTAKEQEIADRALERARRRVGRPTMGDARMSGHTVTLTDQQWSRVQERGGAAYIRRLIDNDLD